MRGFRPGKVPVAHLKRLYGKSAMAEAIEAAVREANSKIITDHGFKLATEPKVVLPSEEGAVDGVHRRQGRSGLHRSSWRSCRRSRSPISRHSSSPGSRPR